MPESWRKAFVLVLIIDDGSLCRDGIQICVESWLLPCQRRMALLLNDMMFGVRARLPAQGRWFVRRCSATTRHPNTPRYRLFLPAARLPDLYAYTGPCNVGTAAHKFGVGGHIVPVRFPKRNIADQAPGGDDAVLW